MFYRVIVEFKSAMQTRTTLTDPDMKYPVIFMPKKYSLFETNCELTDNIYIDVNISSPDSEGSYIVIYNGHCHIKLVDAYETNLNKALEEDALESHEIDQMPVIIPENSNPLCPPYTLSQVWIDPSRSPYVYNHYDPSTNKQFSMSESAGLITVKQNNNYITQNGYNHNEQDAFNYKEAASPLNEVECKRYRKVQESDIGQLDTSYYGEDEFQCGVFLSQLPEEIMNEQLAKNREEEKKKNEINNNERNALKQLMSSDIQSNSKQRKTILFLGEDSESGQTIQNISYNDPFITCAEIQVDNEVVIEDTPCPTKKKYQCDKCKQIFDQISSFRQHMVGKHQKPQKVKETVLSFMCTDCGKNLKTQQKFENHCLGHGDPERECPKCGKVFASKFSLRVHMRIHARKHPCGYCSKAYSAAGDLNNHVAKVHLRFLCQEENCSYVTPIRSEFKDHQIWHKLVKRTAKVSIENNETPVKTERYAEKDLPTIVQENTRSSMDLIEILEGKDDNTSRNLAGSSNDLTGSPILDPVKSIDPANLRRSSRIRSRSGSSVRLVKSEDIYLSKKRMKMTNDEEIRREADSVIAKLMTNSIFLLSTKCARNHQYRKTCEVCLKSFERIDDLKRHLIEHVIKCTLAKNPVTALGFLNITCEVCQSETFTKVDKYKAHLREHAKLTIYKCTFCDKSFSDSSNFSKHKKIHGSSSLQCDLCQRKFNSKKMIAQHMEQHLRTQPVQCEFCPRMFHFESMLKKHIRSTHRKQESSKYRCRFCELVFRSLKEKWEHEWTVHHVRKTKVDCDICGAQYRKYSELKRHCIVLHKIDIPDAKILRKSNLLDFD